MTTGRLGRFASPLTNNLNTLIFIYLLVLELQLQLKGASWNPASYLPDRLKFEKSPSFVANEA